MEDESSSRALLVPLRDLVEHDDLEKRRLYAKRAKADGTWTVYDGHWGRFVIFADERRRAPGPPTEPALLADYIIFLREQGRAASTLSVAVAAIVHRNRIAGAASPFAHPQVQEILAGAKRLAARDQAGRGPSDPLLPADIRSFVAKLKGGISGQRDMALLTFGVAGGFRREELCRLRIENIRFDADGLTVRLPWSKTDQTGEGHTRHICYGDQHDLCPVQNLKTWLAASGIRSGPLFRPVLHGRALERPLSPRRVDQIIREYGRRVAADRPDAVAGKRFSAHSLRSGLCTAAALAGKPEHEIRDHTGHRSAASVARYIRAAKIQKSTVTRGIGL